MNIEQVYSAVQQNLTPGQSAYLVGGLPRDLLLRRTPHDFDLTISGNARSVAIGLANQLNGAFYALDDERGTYRVILNDGSETIVLDLASLRGQTLESDLRARDFTINAMAIDLANQDVLIDPCGGQADLANKILRACGPTNVLDDPVRAMRAFRFAYRLGFTIETQTMEQVRQASGLLSRISAERIRDELFRILDGPSASTALQALDEAGLLPLVLPELAALKGMQQSPPHVFPGWEHTFAVLDRLDALWSALVDGAASNEAPVVRAMERLGKYQAQLKQYASAPFLGDRSHKAMLRFVALYHDCAKPLTRTVDPDGRIRFFNHDDEGARLTARRARALTLSSPEVEWLEAAVSGHMRVHHLADAGQALSSRTIYRFFRDTHTTGIDLCLLSLADTWATYGPTLSLEHWDEELDICESLFQAHWERPAEVISPPRLITGNDLITELGLKPGPLIGKILETVREGQAAGEITTREQALSLARQFQNAV